MLYIGVVPASADTSVSPPVNAPKRNLMATSNQQPMYLQQYFRFAESMQATDAEIQDFHFLAYSATEPGKVQTASASGEILGICPMLLESRDNTLPYTLSRTIPVMNSGLLAVDSDGSLEVGDVVTMNAAGEASGAGTPLAITLNGKDLIVRAVVDGPRQMIQCAI